MTKTPASVGVFLSSLGGAMFRFAVFAIKVVVIVKVMQAAGMIPGGK